MSKNAVFSVSACCPSNLEVQTGQWVGQLSQSPDSATPHLFLRTPYHRRTLELEEDPQMVVLATHRGQPHPTSLEKPGTVSGTMVLATGKNTHVQIHYKT